KLPASLVEEMAKTAVLAQHAWVEARKQSQFNVFEPWLAKTVDLKKREAQCVGWKDHVYDALLDPYEPGETTANLRRVFDSLRDPLIELIGNIAASGKRAPVQVLEGNFPTHLQENFGEPIAEAISLGIHESQSRLWENLVGRRKSFWRFFLPKAREVFGASLRDMNERDWYWAINEIRPTLIRVESDEATYNLHILLR